MANAQIKAVITAEDRASQTLKQFGNNVGGVKGRLKGMEPVFKKMAAVGTASFAAISFGIGKAVKSAAHADQISRNFKIVFGKTSKEMDIFVKDFAKKFGSAETSVRQATTSLGSMLEIATTLKKDAIVPLTKELIHSAEALAFYDPNIKDAEQAVQGFNNAITGNAQQLREWGFNINEAIIEERALKMGLVATTEEQERNNRTLALGSLIAEQTTGSKKLLAASEGTYQDQLKRTTARWQEINETIGSIFLPMINDLLARLEPLLKKFGDWVDENKELVKRLTLGALAVSALVAAIGFLGLALPGIITGFQAFGAAIAFLFANPIGLTLLAIAGAGLLIWKNWEKVAPVVDGVKDAFDRFFSILKEVWDFVAAELGPIVGDFIFFLKLLWTDIMKPMRDWIANQFKKAWEDLRKAFSDLKVELGPIMPQLKFLAVLLGGAVLLSIMAGVGAIIALVSIVAVVTAGVARFIGWLARLQMWLKLTAEGFKQGFAAGIRLAINLLLGFPGRALRAIGNLGGLLYQKGRDLVQGLINGAGSMLANIGRFFLDRLPGWIRGPFEKAMGIGSPSKLFAEYGKNMMQGLAGGIDKSSMLAGEALNKLDLAPTISPSVSPSFSGGRISTAESRGASTSKVTNVNVSFTGVFTGNEKDMRRLAERVFRAEADVASMNGMSLSEKVARA